METKDDYCGSGCCSCCCVLLMFLCLSLGFLMGMMVGAMVEKKGYKITDLLAENNYNVADNDHDHTRYVDGGVVGMSDYKCVVRMTNQTVSSTNCALCSRAR